MRLFWIMVRFACKSMRCCTKFPAAASSHAVLKHPFWQHRANDYSKPVPFNTFCQINKYNTIICHPIFPTQTFLPLGTRTSPPSWQCPSPGASSSSFSWWPASLSVDGKDSRHQNEWKNNVSEANLRRGSLRRSNLQVARAESSPNALPSYLTAVWEGLHEGRQRHVSIFDTGAESH